MSRYVIVGGGQAGLQVADSLRRGGFSGELVLVGAESSLPYQRPPLSKKFLLEDMSPAQLLFRPADFFAKHSIDLRLNIHVTQLDRTTQTLRLADGSTLQYDKLALTLGARVRTLTLPGADDPRILYLRGLTDAQHLKEGLAESTRVLVVGGGFIGLEVAAAARALGKEVTVLEAQERLLQRVVAAPVSAYFAALHTGRGVRILLNETLASVTADTTAVTLETASGARLSADLVVVGIGVVPDIDFAIEAGLGDARGIAVDEHAMTVDRNIFSAGDCTWHRNTRYPAAHRLESVQNAVDQAKVAAAGMLGSPITYDQVPWFWSDQYDVKLQMVGISTGYDALVIRGLPESHQFSVFYFAGDRVIAVDSINRPAEHMVARRLIAAGGVCAQAAVADLNLDLKTLVQ